MLFFYQGETATHAVVFAILITPDGENHGLHAFFIQIRDEKTFENLPGVKIADMGGKLGLNGVDNGYDSVVHFKKSSVIKFYLFHGSVMMLDHFRVPKTALLNRTGDVNEAGIYVSPYKDKKKRLGNLKLPRRVKVSESLRCSRSRNETTTVLKSYYFGLAGASLGNLSSGRVGIAGMATANLVKAITIGIRYSAVRRQFGPENDKGAEEEIPVIEYQLQV